MANFRDLNRYTNGTITVTRDNKQFLVLRKPLNLDTANTDVTVTIQQDLIQRLDLISQKAYGTPNLWWVIAEFNGINDPLFDLRPGTILRIPSLDRVLQAISALNT